MQIRRMLPASRQDRGARYEVIAEDGKVLGWLSTWSSHRGRQFYKAEVMDRGERISLESSTDLTEMAERVARFATHPEEFERHRRSGYSNWESDPDRIVHG